MIRGVRGATTVSQDRPERIEEAVHELLAEMVGSNGLDPEDLAAAFFSVTPDLRSCYPAKCARTFGWDFVPLLDVREADGDPGESLERCIRVLLLWNTGKPIREIRHVYLREAQCLRPDLQGPGLGKNLAPIS